MGWGARADLQKKLPEELLVAGIRDITHIYGGVLILFTHVL